MTQAALPPQMQTLNRMMQMLRAAKNPQEFQNLVSQTPAFRQAADYIQQHGGDVKAVAEQLTRERGVDINDLLQGMK